MHRCFLVMATLLAVAVVSPLSHAEAMTAHPAGLQAAANAHQPVQRVARCWRRGWHGWGRYHCRRYVGSSYRARHAGYWHRPYRYRYSYGWRHQHWWR